MANSDAHGASYNPDFIRLSHVSSRFPISRATLLRAEKRGEIKIHRPSARISLVSAAELEAYLTSGSAQ